MRVHSLEHVKFESLGCISEWLKSKDKTYTTTRFYKNDPLPEIDDIDFLIIMGGPMSVNDEEHYPWQYLEKEFIKKAIDKNKKVLGICLGAQLIASTLGAEVKENKYKEIGFFDVSKTNEGKESKILSPLPNTVEVFQWHGDTFDVPKGAVKLLTSEACDNQAFAVGNNVLALQFHLEMTLSSAKRIIKHTPDEDYSGEYTQCPKLIASLDDKFSANNQLMYKVLDNFVTLYKRTHP